MNTEADQFNLYVIKSIIANNEFGITNVMDINSIKSLNFDYDKYPSVEELIKGGNLELIKKLPSVNIKPALYLEIMQFTDQNKNEYIVTVYDSDELLQDPQVIKIYKL